MDLLIVPVPIFTKDTAVEAYIFRYHSGNDILESRKIQFNDSIVPPPFEMLKVVDVEIFTAGKPIFVPITSYMLLTNPDKQCNQPPEKIIFLLDGSIPAEDEYTESIKRLKSLGFRFAIQKIESVEPYVEILKLCDYILFDCRIIGQKEQQLLRALTIRDFKNLSAVYTHIPTKELFDELVLKAPGWYEGKFYRTPLTKGKTDVSPLQVNLINLLNVVRDEDFEFNHVAGIIAKDPALSVALLTLVNSAYFGSRDNKIKSINQAVTLLGQKEVRKWITTAVAKLMGSDKPSEITRLSLIRARFAECLAAKFGMQGDTDSLFLMGLFSVLDAILDKPMAEALELVHVSEDISDALVGRKGKYFPIFDFILAYESANWNHISRELILRELSSSDVYDAYLNALCWYRDILTDATPL